jgi:hypothetical protein
MHLVVRTDRGTQRVSRAAPGALLLLLLALLALWRARPTPAVGPEAPPERFSAGRAFPDVRVIAREPHPAGSAASRRVQAWLLERLGALGLEPEVQAAAAGHGRAPLANVLARRPGRASTGVLLLAAHHDSKPIAPGAGDDGAAVAAILETLRALATGPPLRNDLVVLLSDGEEQGLLGARHFAATHPWMAEVSVVLNFEARGNDGACLMFETSGESAALVDAYAEAVPCPAANSLMAAVYRRMPNDTDFTVLARERGLPGLNFAFIEGYTAYHSPSDTPANLSLDALQHQGDTMLAMVRRLGNADLSDLGGGHAVYFDLLGSRLVRYPLGLVLPLALLALVLTGVVLGQARGGGRWRPGLYRAALAALGALALAAALAFALGRAVVSLYPLAVSHPARGTSGDPLLFLAASLLALAAVARALGLAARRADPVALRIPGLALHALLLVASAVLLPEASFLFLWPLAGGALALSIHVRASRLGAPTVPARLAEALCLAPAVLLAAPLLQRVYAALTLTGAAAGAGGTALVGLLLVPPCLPASERGRRALYRVLLALGLGALAAGILLIGSR